MVESDIANVRTPDRYRVDAPDNETRPDPLAHGHSKILVCYGRVFLGILPICVNLIVSCCVIYVCKTIINRTALIQNHRNFWNLLNQNHTFPPVMIGNNPIVMSGGVDHVAVETLSSTLFINPKGNFK